LDGELGLSLIRNVEEQRGMKGRSGRRFNYKVKIRFCVNPPYTAVCLLWTQTCEEENTN
jgi:hypothetical protein